ncbi:type II secretion system protein [bacterium]|nr:type II secretion system protein [bacterium]
MKQTHGSRGFTLIEILVVIGLIAILAAIVLIAINPGRQFAQARNMQREANVNTILNAIGQNIAENKGVFNCTVSLGASTSTIGTDGANLGPCLVPTYIASGIPLDPSGGTTVNTGYTISTSTSGRIMVCAPNHAETAISGSVGYCLIR